MDKQERIKQLKDKKKLTTKEVAELSELLKPEESKPVTTSHAKSFA